VRRSAGSRACFWHRSQVARLRSRKTITWVTLAQLAAKATGGISEWLLDRRNRRAIPHRMERCGYTSLHKPRTKEGLWKLQGTRQRVYVKLGMTEAEHAATLKLLEDEEQRQ
jgi:hypothetical protein